MRQTLARWQIGMRTRLLDTWWLVREGPRAAFRRSLVGSVLVVALLVVVAFDVVLLFRAIGDQPASTVPAGIPTGIVSITEDEDPSLIEPVTDPVTIPAAEEEREEAEGRADEGKGNDRRAEDRPSAASDGESATSPSDAPTEPSANDGTNDQPPADEPAPAESPDTGGTGPGGSGPGDGDGGATDGGDTGGGGGGGG